MLHIGIEESEINEINFIRKGYNDSCKLYEVEDLDRVLLMSQIVESIEGIRITYVSDPGIAMLRFNEKNTR